MVKIVLGLVILMALGSGVLSLKNKTLVEHVRQEKVEADTKASKAETARTEALNQAKTSAEEADAASKAKEAALAEASSSKAEAAQAKTDLATAQSQVVAKDEEIKVLKAKVEAIPTGDPTAQPVSIADLQTQLKEAQTKLEEQQQVAHGLEAKCKDAEQRAFVLEQEKERRSKAMNAIGLEGKVLAVDSSWNFVVLSIGDKQGVTPNSTLLVKRGDALVARLQVTTVDPSTAIANIVPGSLPKGSFVRPGDVVIFSGI